MAKKKGCSTCGDWATIVAERKKKATDPTRTKIWKLVQNCMRMASLKLTANVTLAKMVAPSTYRPWSGCREREGERRKRGRRGRRREGEG
jgi:hypothetical protein